MTPFYPFDWPIKTLNEAIKSYLSRRDFIIQIDLMTSITGSSYNELRPKLELINGHNIDLYLFICSLFHSSKFLVYLN